MRALYFTDTYPPQVNGVSVVTELSVRGLEARGWEVGVVAPRYPAGADGFGGTRPEVLLAPASWAFPKYPEIRVMAPAWIRALETARRFAPDVVHCATEFVGGRLGQWVARKIGVPIVTSYHTDFGRYMASYGVPRLQGAMTRYLTRFHRRAARTLTPSMATRAELLDRGIDRAIVWGCGVALLSVALLSVALLRVALCRSFTAPVTSPVATVCAARSFSATDFGVAVVTAAGDEFGSTSATSFALARLRSSRLIFVGSGRFRV